MNAEEMIKNAEDFQKLLDSKAEANDRFLSWIHCYKCFSDRFQKSALDDTDKDFLALNLGFYLASWGMYRASSFLLQRDYKIHKKAVEVLFEYKDLQGKTCLELKLDKVVELGNKINNVYLEHHQAVYKERKARKENRNAQDIEDKEVPQKITDTLITKILMGTLGCSPAYDRYFKDGLKKAKDSHINSSFSQNSLSKLIDFYEKNKKQLEKFRESINNTYKVVYPQMKLLDLVFWCAGNEEALEEITKYRNNK